MFFYKYMEKFSLQRRHQILTNFLEYLKNEMFDWFQAIFMKKFSLQKRHQTWQNFLDYLKNELFNRYQAIFQVPNKV